MFAKSFVFNKKPARLATRAGGIIRAGGAKFLRGDFRVGDWIVHPSLNALERDGETVHLEPKVMQVLLTLASEPSEVFTRESVQRHVWPDVVVGEDVLVRAISKIRRAFGNESVIETVPKVGYRLVAPVILSAPVIRKANGISREVAEPPEVFASLPATEGADVVDAATAASTPLAAVAADSVKISTSGRPTFWPAVLVVLLLLAFGVSFAIWRFYYGHSMQTGAYVTRPFTTDPGSQIQTNFSPDGDSVAYVWHRDAASYGQIYIRSLNSGQPRRLSQEQSANQLNPVWSPDGRQIAFVRKDDTHSSIIVFPSSGGTGDEIYTLPVNSAREYGGLAWSADGASLIFPQQNTLDGPSYLIRLSLRDRTVQSVTAPPLLWDGDFFPAVSPDGRTLAFIRGSEQLARDIYVMSLPSGPVRRITHGCLAMGLAWTEDSSSIVFSSSRNGALSLWRVKATGGDPERLAAVGDDAYAPAIAKHGHRLIYSHGSAMWGIFAVDLQDTSATPAVILTSSEQDAAPHISPSGDSIIFQSWRSGSREIWAAQIDGSNPVQLTDNPGQSAGNPAWSPDGKFIAFDARLESFAHIYVINAGGGKPRAITGGNYNDVVPSWSADGQYLYFGSNRSGSWQIWGVPVDGSHAPRQITSNGGMVAMASSDGQRIYYTKYSGAGLWQQPIAGGHERKIFDGPPAGYPDYWTLSSDGIYALSIVGQQFALTRIDPQTGQERVLDLLKYSPTVGLSIAPDGKKMVYSGLISASSHLTLVEGFR
jgi:Tol biopolymer transport system component/DNA-binding winged helix-turn-helix (wHTH) protein